jgi:signal transduction histidine kinase
MNAAPPNDPGAAGDAPRKRKPRRLFSLQQTIGAGYIVAVLLSLLIGAVASFALQSVVTQNTHVQNIYTDELLELERLRSDALDESVRGRGYLLTGRAALLEESEAARRSFEERLRALALRAQGAHERELLDRISSAHKTHHAAQSRTFALHRAGGDREDIAQFITEEVIPKLTALEVAIDAYALFIDSRLEVAHDVAHQASNRAARAVLVVAGGAVLLAAGLGVLFTRMLDKLRRHTEERLALLAREERAHAQTEAAQRELERSVERLERVNADLDAFAGRIAHDLRNLLTPIALVPPRLRRAQSDDAKQRIATSLERSVTRANAVLEGLLAFSRSGRPAEEMRPASVRDVVAQVAEDLAPVTAAARAELGIDVEDAHVACSPELLHVVVLNLLGNALKYLGPSVERRVSIRAHAEDGDVLIVVDDSGPGIPEGAIARIFEPFFRVPGATAPGTGIGLATVRRIVTAHGGRIHCSSELGRGTSFRVWLPSAPPPTPGGKGHGSGGDGISPAGESLGT